MAQIFKPLTDGEMQVWLDGMTGLCDQLVGGQLEKLLHLQQHQEQCFHG
jgi:hypothetical protein